MCARARVCVHATHCQLSALLASLKHKARPGEEAIELTMHAQPNCGSQMHMGIFGHDKKKPPWTPVLRSQVPPAACNAARTQHNPVNSGGNPNHAIGCNRLHSAAFGRLHCRPSAGCQWNQGPPGPRSNGGELKLGLCCNSTEIQIGGNPVQFRSTSGTCTHRSPSVRDIQQPPLPRSAWRAARQFANSSGRRYVMARGESAGPARYAKDDSEQGMGPVASGWASRRCPA